MHWYKYNRYLKWNGITKNDCQISRQLNCYFPEYNETSSAPSYLENYKQNSWSNDMQFIIYFVHYSLSSLPARIIIKREYLPFRTFTFIHRVIVIVTDRLILVYVICILLMQNCRFNIHFIVCNANITFVLILIRCYLTHVAQSYWQFHC